MIAGMPGDWWIVAAMLRPLAELVLRDLRDKYPQSFIGSVDFHGVPESGGYQWEVTFSANGENPHLLGRVVVSGADGRTTLNISFDDPGDEIVWLETVERLHTLMARSREIRQSAIGFTPDEIIEYYYRQKAAGGKLTMKDIAATTDFSYGYLMQRKMEYDKAGKWGAPNKSPKTKSSK